MSAVERSESVPDDPAARLAALRSQRDQWVSAKATAQANKANAEAQLAEQLATVGATSIEQLAQMEAQARADAEAQLTACEQAFQ